MAGLKLLQIAILETGIPLDAKEDTAKNVVKKVIAAVVTTINQELVLVITLITFPLVLKELSMSSQVTIMYVFPKQNLKVIKYYKYLYTN